MAYPRNDWTHCTPGRAAGRKRTAGEESILEGLGRERGSGKPGVFVGRRPRGVPWTLRRLRRIFLRVLFFSRSRSRLRWKSGKGVRNRLGGVVKRGAGFRKRGCGKEKDEESGRKKENLGGCSPRNQQLAANSMWKGWRVSGNGGRGQCWSGSSRPKEYTGVCRERNPGSTIVGQRVPVRLCARKVAAGSF